MQMLIGKGNYSNTPVSDLHDKFVAVNLEGKLANFSEEEPVSCFKETGMLKRVTGNVEITASNKYEKAFDFLNRAKIIMTYNEFPYLKDTTEGMLRRLLIVPFDLDLKARPEKKIPNIYKKLESELPGILNRILTAFERLQKRDGFEIPAETKALVKGMVYDSDPVIEWFSTFAIVTKDDDDKISLKDAYTCFKEDMEDGKTFGNLSSRGFRKRLDQLLVYNNLKPVAKIYIDGQMRRGLQGVKIHSESGEVGSGDRF